MNESQLQEVYNYNIHPQDSKIYSDEGFVIIDGSRLGGTNWNSFIVKDHKSYYSDSFGGQPENFLLKELPKPIIYHKYKLQGISSKICGSFCLYFFY